MVILVSSKNEEDPIKIEGARVATIQNEPPRGKTNNVVYEEVRHKPASTSTEKS